MEQMTAGEGEMSSAAQQSPGSPPPVVGRSRPAGRLGIPSFNTIGRYGTLIGLVAMVIFFGFAAPNFLTGQNWLNILESASIVGIIGAGLTVTLTMNDFDLSIGQVSSMSGMFAAGIAVTQGTAFGMLAGVGLGAAAGVANGLAVTLLGASAFIVTLGTSFIVEGIIFGYKSGSQISFGIPNDFTNIGLGSALGVKYLVWIWIGVSLLLMIVLHHTPVGRRMYAVGGNPTAARLSGISIPRTRFTAFVIAGLCSGFGGILLASNLGTGNPLAGVGYLLEGFTVCFLGAATLKDGQFNIFGTFVGAIILRTLENGLVIQGASGSWQKIAKGLVLIAAVGITGLLRRSSTRA